MAKNKFNFKGKVSEFKERIFGGDRLSLFLVYFRRFRVLVVGFGIVLLLFFVIFRFSGNGNSIEDTTRAEIQLLKKHKKKHISRSFDDLSKVDKAEQIEEFWTGLPDEITNLLYNKYRHSLIKSYAAYDEVIRLEEYVNYAYGSRLFSSDHRGVNIYLDYKDAGIQDEILDAYDDLIDLRRYIIDLCDKYDL